MKVTDGNGTNLRAKLTLREYVKFTAWTATAIGVAIGVLNFLGLTPADYVAAEARISRLEQKLEDSTRANAAASEANRETAKLLREHLEQTGEGYQRLSRIEAGQRRDADDIQDLIRRLRYLESIERGDR